MTTINQIKNSVSVSKTTIVIDSADRTSGDVNNFLFDLGTTITNIKLIEILDIDFINTLNNINSGNNKLNWVDNLGVTQFSEIPEGTYTIDNLYTKMAEIMDGDSTATTFFAISLNENTNLTTITDTSGITFSLRFGVSENENIGSVLGFGTTNLTDITTTESNEIINLLPTKKIFVGSTNIVEGSTDTFLLSTGISNICYEFDIDDGYGNNIIQREPRTIKNDISSLSSLDFTLKDDNGILLNIPSSVNTNTVGLFSITLDIYSGIFDFSYY